MRQSQVIYQLQEETSCRHIVLVTQIIMVILKPDNLRPAHFFFVTVHLKSSSAIGKTKLRHQCLDQSSL